MLWLGDNGMQLNLHLITVLMCVIKYIAMSQLVEAGLIHHTNWYLACAAIVAVLQENSQSSTWPLGERVNWIIVMLL